MISVGRESAHVPGLFFNPRGIFLRQIFSCLLIATLVSSCEEQEAPQKTDIVEKPEELDARISTDLRKSIDYVLGNHGQLLDSIRLELPDQLQAVYSKYNYQPLWSQRGQWRYLGNSVFQFIERSKEYGLFPSDYHYRSLAAIRNLVASDSIAQKDAIVWTRADLMITDALLLMARHLKHGRLPFDSVTIRKDTLLNNQFYLDIMATLMSTGSVPMTMHSVEPKHHSYVDLKSALRAFLDSAQFKRYTFLQYPTRDSASFYRSLQLRLFEENLVELPTMQLDSAEWRRAIKQYQESHNLKATGKINEATVKSLNNTDWEKFKRIVINLDRYKLLPDTLPSTYAWVNLPTYHMQVFDYDSIVFESRVIIGTPKTRTPLLTSEIVNFITYPQWTVPYSIIFKEMLPEIQKDINYLNKQNLMVVDKNDSVLNPADIDWSKLSKKKFPYLLRQRQGDNNSLGVIKFNFRNKYDVYLHDTNARWLFSRSNRALSHGCVRLQEWEDLAGFLVRNHPKYPADSIKTWIKRQEKRVVSGFQRLPIYIRYFTCEPNDGKITFYDDIYGEDLLIRERYFANKPII